VAYITFTDHVGAAQLDNGMTGVAGGVGSRFRNWTSEPRVIGPRRHALGTGAAHVFAFRTDYVATFELHEIPNSAVPVLDRLIAHLRRGGTCAVYTGDENDRTYATCGLAEGGDVSKRMQEPRELTWRAAFTLVNLADEPADMLCIY
jgi:hypothetical protein